VAPRIRNPRIHSRPARYIHPAEPVYQDAGRVPFDVSPIKRGQIEGRRGVQEPGKPHALALTSFPYPVHAVVPIPCAYQRQLVITDRKTSIERSGAVFEQRGVLLGHHGLKV
jgi:hypothetical protein